MADTRGDSNWLRTCFVDHYSNYRGFRANLVPQHPTALRNIVFKQNGSTKVPKDTQNEENRAPNTTVNLTLVFTSTADVLKYNKHKQKLTAIVKTSLISSQITENSCLQSTNTPIHSVYNIEKIIINSTSSNGHVMIVDEHTRINIDKLVSKDEHDSSGKVEKLGGIEENVEILAPLLQLPADDGTPKPSILLYGPPGTGKTSFVRKMAADLNLRLIYFDCARVFKPSVGESEETLKSLFKTAADLSRIDTSVLFLDQIDTICSIHRSHSFLGKRLIAQLRLLLDSSKSIHRLFVVAATNRIDSLDPSLRNSNYFAREVLIGNPNCDQRREILNGLINDHELIDLHRLAQSTPGYTHADLQSLCQRIENEAVLKTDTVTELIRNFKCTSKRINSEFDSTSTPVMWDAIGGLDEVKSQIRQTLDLQLNKPHVLAHYGLPKPKGILLYGPPGCCKTTLIRAASNDLKLNFLSITPSDIYSPYLGESEKAICEVFRKARINSPTILFIDELDAFVGSRIQSEQSSVHMRVLSTLLSEMDGIGVKIQEIESNSQLEDGGVLVMAATNRPDLIDPALLRPGRFDAMIYLPPPDRDARKSILQVCVNKLRVDDVDLDKMADETELFSGADLENLCREAGYIAMEEDGVNVDAITQRHFDKAISAYCPSLTHQQIKFYTDFHTI